MWFGYPYFVIHMLIAESPGVSSLLLGILGALNALFSIGRSVTLGRTWAELYQYLWGNLPWRSRTITLALGKPFPQSVYYKRLCLQWLVAYKKCGISWLLIARMSFHLSCNTYNSVWDLMVRSFALEKNGSPYFLQLFKEKVEYRLVHKVVKKSFSEWEK